jgi:hypothetical protein
MSPTIHLCLVSAQATPNITPAGDPAVAPRRVVLLVSPDTRRRAEWLAQVLNRRGLRVRQWSIDDPWDVEHVQIRVLELLESEREAVAAKSIALNATGGTKPMSIAAYEAFRAYELPIFFVHPEKDRLIWLHPDGLPSLELADRVRLDAFLAAHGAQVEGNLNRSAVADAHMALAEDLVRNLGRLAAPLKTLNWLAGSAEGSLRSRPLKDWQRNNDALQELIDRFAGRDRCAGTVTACASGTNRGDSSSTVAGWNSTSSSACGECPGRSWRCRTWPAASRSTHPTRRTHATTMAALQDLARGVQVNREVRGRPVRNELDVVSLADNRLYIIECKTRW